MAGRFRGYLPVVVDVETTGLDPARHGLLQLAWTLPQFDEFGSLVPGEIHSAEIVPFAGCEIDPEALQINHIDPDAPNRGALDEKEVLQDCFRQIRAEIRLQGCNRAVLVGHNAAFDHSFIRAAIARQNIKRDPFHPFSVFDTCTLSAVALGQTVLATACDRAGIDFDAAQAHGARYDAGKTAELFCWIVNQWQQRY